MKTYLYPADILIPKKNLEKWSVIACDQYTSEPKYWQETNRIVGDFPSSLNIILPEVYLSGDNSQSISKINNNMNTYLANDIFETVENSVIYTERTLNNGKIRRGLVGLIDLEDYSYVTGSKTPIRATEQTVLERIPPRVKIRCDATIELPHIMLLINDIKNTVIEPIAKKAISYQKLYDFDLMQNAGHLKGYKVDNADLETINNCLSALADSSNDGLLFAVGDGNHSLATAKECYKMGKGSRYALVEIVNIHDTSLEFEPIYRVTFGANPEKLICDFVNNQGGEYFGADAQKFTCIYNGIEKVISVRPSGKLSVATLQKFLDEYIKDNTNIKIDYIHGVSSVKEICKQEGTAGFIFEGMSKSELFDAVSADGSLPRKTFSMGSADDKRFYLEARKI